MNTIRSVVGIVASAALLQSVDVVGGIVDIEYSLSGGNAYQYTVKNNSLAPEVQDFVIYFPTPTGPAQYQNLTVLNDPPGWNGLAVPPSAPTLPGYVDWMALGAGIPPGSALGGFEAGFDYLGPGVPGSQWFEVYDKSWNKVADGWTTAVPEPASMFGCAFLLGLLAAGIRVKQSLAARQ